MGSRAGARPAAWLAASSATGQQEEEQGRAGSTGARAGAQGLARGPYRGRAPLSGVRLAARTAAAGAMSKFSGTTCLQEGEEEPSCILICPNTAPTSPERQLKRGSRKKRRQQIFTHKNS